MICLHFSAARQPRSFSCGQSSLNREVRILGCNFDSGGFFEIEPLLLRVRPRVDRNRTDYGLFTLHKSS
jgi:hypothetical protein